MVTLHPLNMTTAEANLAQAEREIAELRSKNIKACETEALLRAQLEHGVVRMDCWCREIAVLKETIVNLQHIHSVTASQNEVNQALAAKDDLIENMRQRIVELKLANVAANQIIKQEADKAAGLYERIAQLEGGTTTRSKYDR